MAVSLNDDQLKRVRHVFEEALSLPSNRRSAFIRDASNGDDIVEHELLSLVEAHDASEGYFERLSDELITPALAATESDGGDDALLSDLKLSRYEVLARVGGGGMGVVYKARDNQLGRTVALKFLPRRHASNPGARARLIAEARAASRLDHPNIGVVYEIAETDDGRQFIAMAWYDGETLKDRIRRGPIPVAEAVAIASQLGDALALAHADGIIHRDVKPANVMLTRSGGVKLVDFGIAKLISEDEGARQGVAGTVAYMSPEQTRETPLDARTDIWSLGVLLFETLAGQRPFRGESGEQLISAIRSEKQSAIILLRTDVGPDIAKVIDRCLQKDRNLRFRTAAEFSEALKTRQHIGHQSRKYRKFVVAATVVALSITAAVSWHYGRSAYLSRAAMIAPMRSIAVLPFTSGAKGDTSSNVEQAIAEDLRSDLGSLRPITVPGYRSSLSYAASAKPDSQVAREMAANYLIRGSVKRSGGRFELQLHVVDAKTGIEKFAKRYASRPGQVDLVREATRDIVSSLSIPITQEQRSQLNRDRTTSERAYDLYLRGLHTELMAVPVAAFGTPAPGSFPIAQSLYVLAVKLDPAFAAVRSRLAATHISIASAYDTTRTRLDQARLEAEAALRLDPQSPDARAALSAYWGSVGDAERSIGELNAGLQSLPYNVGLHTALASLLFEAGRREDGVAELEKALRLDPRNPIAASRAATSYGRLGRSDLALKNFNHFIEISPNDYEMQLIRGQFYMKSTGTVDTLFAALKRIPAEWDDNGMATYSWYTVLRFQHKYREGIEVISRSKGKVSRDGVLYYPTSLMLADMYYGLGDVDKARSSYERARAEVLESISVDPSNPAMHSALALAEAGLGHKSDAVAVTKRAMDLARKARRGSSNSTARMGIAVEVYARAGDLDRAFETLELLFAMSAGREATIQYLQVWPGFDPLRKDPRLDEMLRRFAAK